MLPELAFTAYTQDKANLISDFQISDKLASALLNGKNQEFFLLLAMLSQNQLDIRIKNEQHQLTNKHLATQFSTMNKPNLLAEKQDYLLGCQQSIAFHQAGIQSAHLSYCLTPSALHFPSAKTQGLAEKLYHNLSSHDRRKLDENTLSKAK